MAGHVCPVPLPNVTQLRVELRELQEALQREVWLREQAEKRVRELVGPLPSAEDVEGILAASSEEPG